MSNSGIGTPLVGGEGDPGSTIGIGGGSRSLAMSAGRVALSCETGGIVARIDADRWSAGSRVRAIEHAPAFDERQVDGGPADLTGRHLEEVAIHDRQIRH